MRPESAVLSREERTGIALRSLYRSYGYKPYRMSRFEPYDLYAQNRSFIVGSSILTFTDTNGRLMALKPDVTMSIVKNYRGGQHKVYYIENVYRESGPSRELTEIMQAGLECIGTIDPYSEYEVITLACESLQLISDRYILDLASSGVVEALLGITDGSAETKEQLLEYVQSKNAHNISELCTARGIPADIAGAWQELAQMYGPLDETLPRLRALCAMDPGMQAACQELEKLPCGFAGAHEHIMLDFSIIADLDYYNGLVFRGSVEGIPTPVLSGGRYDRLVSKLGKDAGAIGFAVYLDALSWLDPAQAETDADALLLYGPDADPEAVLADVRSLVAEGRRALAVPNATAGGGGSDEIVRVGGQDG